MMPLSLRAVGLAALFLAVPALAEDEDVLEWITVPEPTAASPSPLVQLTDATLLAFVKEHDAVLVEL
jgi:hypothetical protein